MARTTETPFIKVPEVTLVFWILKIIATTLGETGGNAVSMSMDLGSAVSSGIFIGAFAIAVAAQIAARAFHPFLYWAVIIATTTAGPTMADFFDRSLGIGYAGGSAILLALSRVYASAILAAFIVAGILLLPQRAGKRLQAG